MAASDLVDLEALERPAAPRVLGDYTLQKVLGRGGMGMVWFATRRRAGDGVDGVEQPCVVKTLRADNDPEYERRFIDEARLLVLLSHKNICGVLDAGCFEGQYYLAMEHIDGLDLKKVATMTELAGEPLPLRVVVYVVREVLEALDVAHRTRHPTTKDLLKVVHRDVSPQNVMLGHDGRVKLIDFGLALSTQKVEKTAPSVVMGKLSYMSPEQARGEPIDGRADQFAVGVLLYELLANARYYEGLSLDETWRKSGAGGHIPLRWKNLDDGLREIVKRSTAPVAADRYLSCAAMSEALARWAHDHGQAAGAAEAREALRVLDDAVHFIDGPTGERPRVMSSAGHHAIVESSQPPAPRERTRTFRLSELDGAAASTMGDGATEAAPASPSTRAEPTLLVRAPFAAETSRSSPPSAPSRRPLVAAAVVLSLLALAATAVLWRDESAAVPVVVDAGAQSTVVVDAGTTGTTGTNTDVVDAGTAGKAGTNTVVVDVGATGKSGTNSDVVDAGVTTRTPPIAKPPPKVGSRALPPWPEGAVLRQAALLRDHCRDVGCTAPLLKRLAQPDGPTRKLLERELGVCYAVCKRTPR